MKNARRFSLIASIIFCSASIVLAVVMYSKTSVDPVLFEFAILIKLIKFFAVFSLAFIVLFILSFVVKDSVFTVKRAFSVFAVLIVAGIIVASISCYNTYNSQFEIYRNSETQNNEPEIEKYFPYKNEIEALNLEDTTYQICKTYSDDVIGIGIFNTAFGAVSYDVEYYQFDDSLLTYKFASDREIPSEINDYFPYVYGESFEDTYNGIKYTLYIDGYDYVVAIKSNKYCYYAYLYKSDVLGITSESFVKTAVEQFNLIQQLTELPKDKF